MQIYPTTVVSNQHIADQTPLLTIKKPADFAFTAGQFVKLRLPQIETTDPLADWRWFSIASAPHQEIIEFCARDGPSEFKKIFATLKPGDPIEISQPSGKFVLPETTDQPIVFLAGGVGITPVRSMLLEAIHNNSPQQMILFYSNYRPEDCAFAQEFFELDKNHKYFRCIPTMTEMEKSKQPWDGETGFIDLAMLKRYLPDINQPRYYIVGSPGFVKAMTAMLETAAIAKEKIKLEKFTGL